MTLRGTPRTPRPAGTGENGCFAAPITLRGATLTAGSGAWSSYPWFAYPDPAMEKMTDGGQCRFATTDELLAIAEKESKRELAWFWELYLRQPALPELLSEVKDGALQLAWKTPGDLPFPMPVDVKIDEKITRVEMKDGRASVPLNGAKEFVVDPLNWILRVPEAAPAKRTKGK